MNKLSDKLNGLISSLSGFRREIVVACVGTDSVLGDCLGALVGQMLINAHTPCYVYGTLANPITALNANEYSRFIANRHPDAVVIAVDSCIGLKRDLGKIRISKQKLFPAAALNKRLIGLGDISVTAVTSDSAPGLPAFSSVRLGFVYPLAAAIASSLTECIRLYNYTAKTEIMQSLTPVFSIRV